MFSNRMVSLGLLGAILAYTTDVQSRDWCTSTYTIALDGGMDELELRKMLINMLADGVNHGNWGWENYKGKA
jgi:hypothetical protein